MSGARTLLAAALALAVPAAAPAKVTCPDKVDLRTCIGVEATATVRFCFLPNAGCAGAGAVKAVEAPRSPFELAAMRVQGPLGTRPVDADDLPLLLLPGESLLLDVAVTPDEAGDKRRQLELVLANRLDDGDGGPGGKIEGDVCEVDLRVRAPGCPPADAGDQCATQTCEDGTCKSLPAARPCDDGDACTVDDACDDGQCSGRRIQCDDGIACTRDTCTAEGCRSEPDDARCDAGDCAVAACRPTDPNAGEDGCVRTPVGEGETCTDDGFACTDDVCSAGACLHVPVDGRCPGAASCASAACEPANTGADAAGCVSGADTAEGGLCAEDGDPCSDDRCRDGICRHEVIANHPTCAPVENAFRRALALLALTRSLTVSTEAVGRAQSEAVRRDRLTAPLLRLDQELDAAVAALSGRTPVPIGVTEVTGVQETPAQARARAALLVVGRMPLEARSFLRALAAARRQGLSSEQARGLAEQGRALRRGVKRLKVELKRLRRTKVEFAR